MESLIFLVYFLPHLIWGLHTGWEKWTEPELKCRLATESERLELTYKEIGRKRTYLQKEIQICFQPIIPVEIQNDKDEFMEHKTILQSKILQIANHDPERKNNSGAIYRFFIDSPISQKQKDRRFSFLTAELARLIPPERISYQPINNKDQMNINETHTVICNGELLWIHYKNGAGWQKL